MSYRKQSRRWLDSESSPADSDADIRVETTFRHMPPSAAVVARVQAEAQKLRRYFDRIRHCRAVIVAPHRHHRYGRDYTVRLEFGVPRTRLVVSHGPPVRPRLITARRLHKRDEVPAPCENLYLVIREVFDAARRQLEDYARRMRGDVKRHLPDGERELLETEVRPKSGRKPRERAGALTL